MEINDLTGIIISSAIEVHKHLGPGLVEKVYEKALVHELELRGIKAESQIAVPIMYKGVDLSQDDEKPLRLDILVNDTIVVELKSVEEMKPLYGKQLLTYLKLMNKHIGLLINFNVPRLVDGVERVINGYL